MKFIALAAAALALSAPAFAHAQATEDGVTSVAVHHGDLDLSQPREAARMIGRLEQASMQACGASEFSLTEYKAAVRDSDCYRATLQQGVAATNAPMVTSLYAHHPEVRVGSR